ncbi:hypothetical protein ACLB2K_075084 [Fragaria x ananassa]
MAMFVKAEDEYNDLMSKKNIIENDKSKIKMVIEELDEKKKETLNVTWVKVNKTEWWSAIPAGAFSDLGITSLQTSSSVDAALDLSHTQNIGRMIKSNFPHSQSIVVSLKEGMFNC